MKTISVQMVRPGVPTLNGNVYDDVERYISPVDYLLSMAEVERVAGRKPTFVFAEISMVDCSDIKSQWQAYFSQRFPVGGVRVLWGAGGVLRQCFPVREGSATRGQAMSLLTFSACKIGTVAIMVAMCLGVGCIGGSGTSNFVMPFAHMTTGPVEEINWPKDSRDKMLAMMLKKVQVNPEPAKTFDCPVCQADPSESPHCPVCDAIRNLPVDCRFACPVCTGTYEGSNAVHYTYIQDTPAIEPSRKPNIVEKHIGKDVVIP